MKSELTKIENSEHTRWKSMIDNIKKYLKNSKEFCTMQQVMEHNVIFRRFIVRDWFSKNENTCKRCKRNKAMTKLCV